MAIFWVRGVHRHAVAIDDLPSQSKRTLVDEIKTVATMFVAVLRPHLQIVPAPTKAIHAAFIEHLVQHRRHLANHPLAPVECSHPFRSLQHFLRFHRAGEGIVPPEISLKEIDNALKWNVGQ